MHCLTTVVFLICIQHFDSTLKLKVCSAGGGVSKLTPKIQPLVKLPVWPAWSGIGAQVTDWLDLKAFSQKIVNKIGGRVVPMDLSGQNGGPFLLLVHHMHSFSAVDPMRYFSRLLLPEGFPSHPHSGFDTGTQIFTYYIPFVKVQKYMLKIYGKFVTQLRFVWKVG